MTALESLCIELACGDDERAGVAATQLPGLGRPALEALRPLFKAQDADTRWWAIRALAGFDELGSLTTDLLAALDDGSAQVRQAAALAFSQHPEAPALEPLVRALADPDGLTARLASNALIKYGRQATTALLDVLENGQPAARLEAARALAEIQDPGSIAGLMRAMESGSAMLQYWATLGLEKMGVGMLYLKPE